MSNRRWRIESPNAQRFHWIAADGYEITDDGGLRLWRDNFKTGATVARFKGDAWSVLVLEEPPQDGPTADSATATPGDAK